MTEDYGVTCEGYGTWVEESIARAIRLQREELALWFWDDPLQGDLGRLIRQID